jgi:hypothetical protein
VIKQKSVYKERIRNESNRKSEWYYTEMTYNNLLLKKSKWEKWKGNSMIQKQKCQQIQIMINNMKLAQALEGVISILIVLMELIYALNHNCVIKIEIWLLCENIWYFFV